MTSIGYATLDVIPSMRGFRSALDNGTRPALTASGAEAGRRFSGSFTRALKFGAVGGGIGAAFGIASFIKDSVTLEAEYGKTMAQMRVATKAPADELQRLDDLAVRLGKETVFSAVDASDAMLELAKNGIKPATIEAGALESALTLAAAGGVDLTQSATAMGNALNAFGLKGGKSASVAAALAGAANASSASVGSLAEGLQQASTVAADVGFNVQETTGILAAFANAGIEGSDAGTSLKTMLSRLLPTTAKAKDYMRRYGLSFTKANGEFKNAVEIADSLNKGLGELSATERSQALNVLFGSDARRAATILTKEGAEGLRDYIKATSDQGAAEEMAQANMEGTAGSIERLKGAWETAKLEFGKSIAPVAADFLDYLADNIDEVAPKLVDFGEWFAEDGVENIKQFKNFVADDVLPVLKDIGEFASDAAGFVGDLSGAFGKLPDSTKLAAIATLLGGGAALKLRGGGDGALGTAGKALGIAKPIPVFVTNKGFGAGGVGGGAVVPDGDGKKSRGGGRANAAAGLLGAILSPVLVDELIKELRYPVDELNRIDREQKRTPLVFETQEGAVEFLDAAQKKADGFGATLDLIGNKKVEPLFAVPGLAKGREGLAEFIRLQIEADKPVAPYINTTSIERAIQLARTLDASLPGNSNPNAGVDNGAGFMSGGTPATSGRGGVVIDQRGSTIVAHDYDDFTGKLQRKAQAAGLGGRPGPRGGSR